MKLAQLSIYKKPTPNEDNYTIILYANKLKLATKVIDIEVLSAVKSGSPKLPNILTKIAITTDLGPLSSSNVLAIYKVAIYPLQTYVTFTKIGYLSVSTCIDDSSIETFKVTKMLAVPPLTPQHKEQVFVVLEDTGVTLFQLSGEDSLEIVHTWNLKSLNRFTE